MKLRVQPDEVRRETIAVAVLAIAIQLEVQPDLD